MSRGRSRSSEIILKWSLFLATILFVGTIANGQSNEVTQFPSGYPCDLIPNFCDRVQCVPPEECYDGILVADGGNCGCCEVCVRYTAGLNDPCTGTVPDPAVIPANTLTQYYEYTDVCHQTLACNSGTCGNAGNNTEYYHLCLDMQVNKNVAVYTSPPTCDFYGYFTYKRCKGLDGDNPRCYCVDKNGVTIFGRLPTGSDNVTCACSRAYADNNDANSDTNPEAGRFIRCQETGDFALLQCFNDVCFCVNKTSAMVISSAVPISAIKALPCYSESTDGDSFYTDCQKELFKMTTILKEFKMKGVTVNDIDTTKCDPDGTYYPVQYTGDQWFCADREGGQILSFVTQSNTDFQRMLCNCARDQKYSDGLPDNARGRQCLPYGNYNEATPKCVDSTCYCLDSDGQRNSCDFPQGDDYTSAMECPATWGTTPKQQCQNQ